MYRTHKPQGGLREVRRLCTALALTSVVSMALAESPQDMADRGRKTTTNAPDRNVTRFEPALRCMDRLFVNYGIRGVPFMIEEIPDATKKVNVGAREMFMSATSRMSQRSGAIRLIPFQNSVILANRQDFIDNTRFVLQGSVSQLDESLVRRQRDGSICLGPICLGGAESDTYNALGLDMNVIRTSDFSLLPGVSSKNSVLIVKRGVGADGELNMKKFGLSFNFALSRSDGNGQALRALIELGAIELYGRLMKIPYWSCLGQNDAQEEVQTEIEDWWESMAADPQALVTWLQTQMAARKLYTGEINGIADDSLLRAVSVYKGAMGLPADEELDLVFFRTYLKTDHAKVEGAARQAMAAAPAPQPAAPATTQASTPVPAPTAPVSTAPVAPIPGVLTIRDRASGRTGGVLLGRGERYELDIIPPRDGHLYCWLFDDRKTLNLFYPNPAQRQPQVRAGGAVAIPGNMGFSLSASKSGLPETVACAMADKDLGFDPLSRAGTPPRDLLALRNFLVQLAGPGLILGAFDVTSK